jgi:hypothetical protein
MGRQEVIPGRAVELDDRDSATGQQLPLERA